MRHTMPSIGGITWDRLEREHAVTYPVRRRKATRARTVVFTDHFPREGGVALFVPADIIPAAERPDDEYPLVLITGRQLEHWHTGSMTRRAHVLDAIEPDPVALVHPLDLAAPGRQAGRAVLTIAVAAAARSRCTPAPTTARRAARSLSPSCYYEAAINRLTNAALDPFAKIPEFKYCAIRRPGRWRGAKQSSYGGGQLLAAAAN